MKSTDEKSKIQRNHVDELIETTANQKIFMSEDLAKDFSNNPVEVLVEIIAKNKLFLIDAIVMKYGIDEFRSRLLGNAVRISGKLSPQIDPETVLDNFEYTLLSAEVKGVVDNVLMGGGSAYRALPNDFHDFHEFHATDLLYRLGAEDLAPMSENEPNLKFTKIVDEIVKKASTDNQYAQFAASIIQGRFGYDVEQFGWINKGNEAPLSLLMKTLLVQVGIHHKNIDFYKLPGAMIAKTDSMKMAHDIAKVFKDLYPGTPSIAYETFGRYLVSNVNHLNRHKNNSNKGDLIGNRYVLSQFDDFLAEQWSRDNRQLFFSLRKEFSIRAFEVITSYADENGFEAEVNSAVKKSADLSIFASLDIEDFEIICGLDDLPINRKIRSQLSSVIKAVEQMGVEKFFAQSPPAYRTPFAVFCLKAMAKGFDEPTPFLEDIMPHILNMAGDLSQHMANVREKAADHSNESLSR